jgi:hypothetical protein
MPGELFRHLWNTIHKGDVFRAVIKNQKKDGHHYWVNATIIPVFRGAQLAGYIGAGQVISNDQVAEELFLKQAREFGWHLQPGTTLFISR